MSTRSIEARTNFPASACIRQLCPDFILDRHRAGLHSGTMDAGCIDVDISGFTVATEALSEHGRPGAELLAEIIRAVIEPLTSSVYEHGGFVANYTGDGFLALFPGNGEGNGDPDADGAGGGPGGVHALAAAWQMRQSIRSRHSYSTPLGDFDFNARIGLARGAVRWRILTGPERLRHAYCFTGTPIVEAARVRQLAGPGELFTDAATAARIRARAHLVATPDRSAAMIADADRLPEAFGEGRPGGFPTDPLVAAFYPEMLLRSSARGEFRQSVNLFINLDRAEQDLDGFAAAIFAAQERYGGYLQGITDGDKGCSALLLWGAPVATENDIARALEFVSELLARPDLRLRAGLTHGLSHAGFLGSGAHEVYGCHSSAVNLAARLMTEAEWGRILMDRSTRDYAVERFAVAFAGNRPLKGFAAEQPVYVLGERRSDVARVRTRGPLVDREAELGRLRDAVLAAFREGATGVAVAVGEAGAGKSSLIAALGDGLAAAPVRRPRWIQLSADDLRTQSLGPFRRALREILGMEGSSRAPADRRDRFDEALDAVIARTPDETIAADLDVMRSFLAALVDVQWEGSVYSQVGADFRARNTARALVQFFRALALESQLVLVAEDIHDYDQESREVLRLIAAQPKPAISLVVSSRPADDGSLPRLPVARNAIRALVELGSLSRDGVRSLAERALDAPVSSRVIDFLVHKTGGNPFYLEQLLLTLGARGAFVHRGSGANTRIELAEDAGEGIPSGINGILIARIDKLHTALKTVVQTAAVLGQEVDVALLRTIHADDVQIDEHIEAGLAQHIWERQAPGRVRFRHALLRDVAYDMQLVGVRRSLHRQAAEALERSRGDQNLARLGALAFHYERAGMEAEAKRYLKLAGDAAHRSYEPVSAVDFYRRLLAYPLDVDHEIAICTRLGELMSVTGDWDEAVTVLNRGLSRIIGSRPPYPEIEILIALGDVLRKSNDHASARERLELARAAARRVGNIRLLGKATVVLAGSYKYAGDTPRCLELYESALKIGEEIGDRRLIGVALAGIGSAHGLVCACPEAIEFNRRAIPILEEVGDLQELMYPLSNLGIDLFTVGNYEESFAFMERSLRESSAIGDREGIWFALHFIARVHQKRGNYREAIAGYERSMLERLALGGDGIPYDTLPHLAWAQFEAGNDTAALRAVLAHLDNIAGGEPDREHGLTHLMGARLLIRHGGHDGSGDCPEELRALFGRLVERGPGSDPADWFRLAERAARAGGGMGLAARIHTLAEYAQHVALRDGDLVRACRCLAAAHALAEANTLAGDRAMVEDIAAGLGLDPAALAAAEPLPEPFGP